MNYFLYITGCDMNVSDAERVASVFNYHGFNLTSDEKEADVIIAFACSVREKAVHKIMGLGNKWRKLNQKSKIKNQNDKSKLKNKGPITILTGCILPQDKKKLEERFDLVFDIKEIGLLNCYIATLLKNQSDQNNNKTIQQCNNILSLKRENGYLSINPSYQNKFSVYLPIMTGCDNFCSYCAVPYTRGREVSRSEENILEEVQKLVKSGYKEITLLGQNVNSYGIKNQELRIKNYDSNSMINDSKNSNKFVDLLKKIDQLDGDYWVRFYANHPKDFSDELIDFLKNAKHFCHYIHLPLQSGDDEILRKMNRNYTVEQYLKIIKKIQKEIPDCAITTDIIVGFPGEDEKAFQNTVKVLKKVGFDMIFISEYSPRSGTVAYNMKDDVSHEEKGRRKKFLNDVVLARSVLANNKKLVGKEVRVLVSGTDKKGFLKGKTAGLKDIRVSIVETQGFVSLQGKFINVKITNANSWGLEGKMINE